MNFSLFFGVATVTIYPRLSTQAANSVFSSLLK
jgi:hypothetical protein